MLILTVDQEARNQIHEVKPGDEYHVAGAQPGTWVLSPEKYEEFIRSLSSATPSANIQAA